MSDIQLMDRVRAARTAGELEEARNLLAAQLRYAPNDTVALNGAAEIEIKRGRSHIASALCHKAVTLGDGQVANHWAMLGVSLGNIGRHGESAEAFLAAIALTPNNPRMHQNLGIELYIIGDIAGARRHLERSLELDPSSVDVRSTLGIVMMAQGDLINGLREFEARWTTSVRQPIWETKIPEWQGEDLADKTIVVHPDAGDGDAIQFIRFAQILHARRAHVIAAIPGRLWRTFASVPGVDEIVEHDALLPDDFRAAGVERRAHYHTPISSMMRHLGVTFEWLSSEDGRWMRQPYIAAPKTGHGVDKSPGTKLTIGIVWGGNPGYKLNKQRSMPLRYFFELLKIPGVQLFSLQKGEHARELREEGAETVIPDLSERLGDWADTAALMNRLDLIISVDSGPLHLAGALGRPVIGLLSLPECWRWLRDREDTPWYQTMTLVRQREIGDWGEMMTRARHKVEQIIQ